MRVNDRGPYARGPHHRSVARAPPNCWTWCRPARRGCGSPISAAPISTAAPAAPGNPAGHRQCLARRAGRQGGHRRRWASCPAPRSRRRARQATCRPRPVAGRRCSPPTEPNGQVTKVPVPPVTHLYVQVGAFSKLDNAKALLSKLGGDLRISTLQRSGQTLYRVRTGPLDFGGRTPMPRCPYHRRGQQRRPYRRRSIISPRSYVMRRFFLLLSFIAVALSLVPAQAAMETSAEHGAADGRRRPGRCCGRRTAWRRCRRPPCPS